MTATATQGPWLVSRPWDLAVFGGSAALAFALLLWGHVTGLLDTSTPPWAWVATILFVDVAHVWSTAYRVYLDPEELSRRPGLFAGVPLAVYVVGVLLYSASSGLFWRVLAYVAVYHFVRQQYGWVALYRRRLGQTTRLDRFIDDAAIYAATIYPILWWHGHMPREFEWFIEGDFLPGMPAEVVRLLGPVHWIIMGTYVARQIQLRLRGVPTSTGKDLIVATTWLAWYVGIVALDSDYAFTVTNVLIHGIPYLGLIWIYGRSRWKNSNAALARLFRPRAWPLYVAPLVLVAWSEEWIWDRFVWHERGAIFPGPEWLPSPEWLALLVPLLALPQASHYVLDAWIWKVKQNPGVARHLHF